MKQLLYHLLIVFVPVCLIAATANQPEIKLTTSKDHVLPIQKRTFILEAGETYLNRSDDLFAAEITNVKNPYLDKSIELAPKAPETNRVVYDDASILELIQTNFAQQVRGTLSKGDVYYLQLNGGGLLAGGDNFPAQIPQVKGESFTVTILEITPDGYTLKMKDVVQGVTFEKTSGIIKNPVK